MVKILYIAPFRDFSGYSTAARGYARALYSAGADIALRSISYDATDVGKEYKPTLIELQMLNNRMDDADVIIQHLTPNEMRLPSAIADKVNIAIVAWETSRIPEYWVKKLNKFDAVITFCDTSVKAFCDSGVTTLIHKVPHCFDIASYSELGNLKPLKIKGLTGSYLDDRFVFYNISQFGQKKGLDVLLQAYFHAFWDSPNDVILVLKTFMAMKDRQNEHQKIGQWMEHIRASMRLPQYPPVCLITEILTEKEIAQFHVLGDCYVCSSRAEGWCIPAFDSLAYGNKLVTTTWGGMGEYAHQNTYNGHQLQNNVFPVKYSLEPLVGQQHPDPVLYTALDFIADPSITSMSYQMKQAKEVDLLKAPDLSTFDYATVGPDMLGLITRIATKELENVV
jgi:glycosyltransferase involved in cell wall biosynthesis